MTLADLWTALLASDEQIAKRAKDYQTAIRYLATALGHTSPSECQVDATMTNVTTWHHTLETHFDALSAQGRTISASTRRNTRNSLRVIFRAAERLGLLAAPLPVPLLDKPHRRHLFQKQQDATAPYKLAYRADMGPRHFGLPQDQWPADCLAGWQEYLMRRGLGPREVTTKNYATNLSVYFGYLSHIVGRMPCWEDCFDPIQLTAFVQWHAARVGRRPISDRGRMVVGAVSALATALHHDRAPEVAKLRKSLPTPRPMHVKRTHWVSLAQLEAVADACLNDGRAPLLRERGRVVYLGAGRASRFQVGVALKLMVRVPIRQRNIREIRLGDEGNLYQDKATGHWILHFEHDELKVSTVGGKTNEYHRDLTAETDGLIPVLEEFLTVHRPKLRGAATEPFLFLTKYGRAFSDATFHNEIQDAVAARTGQRFYPHLIRTIWATEYLQHPETLGDFQGAASALGDTVQVVMRRYIDVIPSEQHAKNKAFLAAALKPKPPKAG